VRSKANPTVRSGQRRRRALQTDLGAALNDLYALIESRNRDRPEGSYTAYLFEQGLDKILKKVGEESSETIIAAKNQDRGVLAVEVCDLLYHLIVLMVERGLTLEQICHELISRGKKRDAQ
jgi:phosphoribosyl-ATP pyrophosphohydrolase